MLQFLLKQIFQGQSVYLFPMHTLILTHQLVTLVLNRFSVNKSWSHHPLILEHSDQHKEICVTMNNQTGQCYSQLQQNKDKLWCFRSVKQSSQTWRCLQKCNIYIYIHTHLIIYLYWVWLMYQIYKIRNIYIYLIIYI